MPIRSIHRCCWEGLCQAVAANGPGNSHKSGHRLPLLWSLAGEPASPRGMDHILEKAGMVFEIPSWCQEQRRHQKQMVTVSISSINLLQQLECREQVYSFLLPLCISIQSLSAQIKFCNVCFHCGTAWGYKHKEITSRPVMSKATVN